MGGGMSYGKSHEFYVFSPSLLLTILRVKYWEELVKDVIKSCIDLTSFVPMSNLYILNSHTWTYDFVEEKIKNSKYEKPKFSDLWSSEKWFPPKVTQLTFCEKIALVILQRNCPIFPAAFVFTERSWIGRFKIEAAKQKLIKIDTSLKLQDIAQLLGIT